jgi:hypothetical protein
MGIVLSEAALGAALYATPWNPWTLVETLDNKLGAISRKTLKWRHDVLPA